MHFHDLGLAIDGESELRLERIALKLQLRFEPANEPIYGGRALGVLWR
jgi:hypothetical protein